MPKRFSGWLQHALGVGAAAWNVAKMPERLNVWLQLWVVLTVVWTIVAATFGWMYLPRAQQMPHNPQFVNKLSNEASLILLGGDSKVETARGALVWSEVPMIVRMSNGTDLTFPAITTNERAALVAGEYYQLLDAEASERRGPYVLGMVAVWFLPCVMLLIAGIAAVWALRSFHRAMPESRWRIFFRVDEMILAFRIFAAILSRFVVRHS
ncbi:MAG: hypothetical protein Q7R45_03590 [Sulfuricaulis sp.]|nr:hypothetical protein [Sulfuricaulis sp.]